VIRQLEHLAEIGRKYPDVWKILNVIRADRGKGLPAWPDWCWCPVKAAYEVVSIRCPPGTINDFETRNDITKVAALGAWRTTQGIYRFDPTMYEALIRTPIEGDLPCELLKRLPEWCVYIECPGQTYMGRPAFGVYVFLEWDVNTSGKQWELRLLYDCPHPNGLLGMPLHLGEWSLAEAIERTWRWRTQTLSPTGNVTVTSIDQERNKKLALELEPVISLILYLCSEANDIGDGQRRPARPRPVATKKGTRFFPAERPTVWDVGVRVGAALRRAYAIERNAPAGGTHASPRPHVRKAHWHSFRIGERIRDGVAIAPEERDLIVKWLPPIPINVSSSDDLAVTIHPVE
jgi:hypothetical protein